MVVYKKQIEKLTEELREKSDVEIDDQLFEFKKDEIMSVAKET